jgi:predicted nucleotidyltransferase
MASSKILQDNRDEILRIAGAHGAHSVRVFGSVSRGEAGTNKASEEVALEDEEKRRYVELALERARYEAKRAERQFDQVEPENRLVAAELEGRWNGALAQVAELESRLQELKYKPHRSATNKNDGCLRWERICADYGMSRKRR